MEFRIADTFTAALTKLSNQEQKAVKTAVFDFQVDPESNALQPHRIKRSKDKHFWSIRASQDLRIIVHRDGERALLCYVDHHDSAYQWAADRVLEIHPTTGAAQLVELVQTVRELERAEPEASPTVVPPLEAYLPEQLLKYGVPPDWIELLRAAPTPDAVFRLAERLPGEAGEAVVDLALGNTPDPDPSHNKGADPFDHPDARRRFRMVDSLAELQAALDYPWEQWTIFLHPKQQELIEKEYSGPARVTGAAGTGKSIVALHRAVHLSRRYPEKRVLLITLSEALANGLRAKRDILIAAEPGLAKRIEVATLDRIGQRLYKSRGGQKTIASEDEVRRYIFEASLQLDHEFTLFFLLSEWREVIDPGQIKTWSAYKDLKRVGRGSALREPERERLWTIFESVRTRLEEDQKITSPGLFHFLARHFRKSKRALPYDYVVIDEAQELSMPQLRFLAAYGGQKKNGLFFTGDLAQRTSQRLFSWEQLGIRIRGRSHTLRISYRTSHQILEQAERLLSKELIDGDGQVEPRGNIQSAFNGEAPQLRGVLDASAEIGVVSEWLRTRLSAGIAPHEIAVVVRSSRELPRGEAAIRAAEQQVESLDKSQIIQPGRIILSTMPMIKGLEFRAVAVMACEDTAIPDPERLEIEVHEPSDEQEVLNTERQLLYVVCTRARDHLLISWVGEGSRFLTLQANRK